MALSAATFMQVLDTSIANVAIPAIAGDLGGSPTQATWVITAFAVSNAITLPLTGWLARRFGEVRVFVAAVLLFTLASWGCGLSHSLGMLIAFRVLQGAVAGPLIPLSQSLLISIYPPQKRGTALALWSMTTLVAPIAGPITGGWITDNVSWPWIFYINVPVGLFAMWIGWSRLRHRETPTAITPIDGMGLFLLVVGVGALQMMLDLGKELDWFSSREIIALAVVAVLALSVLIVWELTTAHPVVDLRLFARRNFTTGAVATSLAYMVFFGSVVILPLWLQTQAGYTPTWAGLATAPTGILAIALMPFVGRNMHRMDPRKTVTASFLIFALTAYWRAGFNTDADFVYIAMPQLIQGVATAFFFVPLLGITMAGVPPERIASAAGLANFLRILAGSFGTSLSTTLWERRATVHHAQLVEPLTPLNPLADDYLSRLQAQGLSPEASLAMLERAVNGQSVMMATNDVFWVAALIFIALIPLVWFARPPFMAQGTAVAD
ncbi:MAG TPA: DHA2 family efflux MFS transporter permease subunit [Burkholderiaceae bacterium]|nr:DHA2 family efflux MFS transporter permease subunit [Burkholderiaceae bacterium]